MSCLALSVTALSRADAQQEFRTATAIRSSIDREMSSSEAGIVSMSWKNPLEPVELVDFNFPSDDTQALGTAVRVGDTYYYYTYCERVYGYKSIGFYKYDLEEGTLQLIGDFGSEDLGICFSNLTYDYTDGTMYALDGLMGGNALVTIDLTTGLPNKVADLRVPIDPEHWDYPDRIATIGMNYDGVLFGLTYWGHIVKINKFTGEVKVIADMDYMPEKAFMYNGENGMFFDHATGECYLQLYTYPQGFEIRKVDLKTGHSELFSSSFSNHGMYLPFKAAEPSSPGQVTGFTVTAGAEGTLKATLSWTNPVKTYGRGGTLEDLDRIEVYRNDELIHTIDSPVIGGKETFEDTPVTPDYYVYKIVGYNESGRGDRCCVSAYIGMGKPCTPDNVEITRDGDNVRLTWHLAEKGIFDSYLDHSKVVFDIWRCSGTTAVPVREKIAEGVHENNFLDSPARIGYYSYQILARNDIGESDYAQSDRIICGPSIYVPTAFSFTQDSDVQVWTILDGNGDGDSWKKQQIGPFNAGMKSEFNALFPYPAMEYMISPYVHLEKGKHYKVTFKATPGSDKVREVLAVSFGKQPTPEAQDSIAQYNIISKTAVNLRTNLPVVEETGDYHFGFVHRTAVAYWNLTLTDISIEEHHDGSVMLTIKDNEGQPVKNARITNTSGYAVEVTEMTNGRYLVNYLHAGSERLKITALGYFDTIIDVDITEYESVDSSVELQKRPLHTLTGMVKDCTGEALAGAKIILNGYTDFETVTDGHGRFKISSIHEAEGYNLGISMNRYMSHTEVIDITSDNELGEIILSDNIRAPRTVKATEEGSNIKISWTLPANDPMEVRYDDGIGTQFIGLNNGNENSTFGVVYRVPGTLHSVDFYIGSTPTYKHDYVRLYVFDLDENGNPTSELLYKKMYVEVEDDKWNTHTLGTPVEAPRGCYVAVTTEGNVCLGIDGGGSREDYPFMPHTNCFCVDYQSGQFNYLEDQDINCNIMMRAMVAPYDEISARASFIPAAAARPASQCRMLDLNPVTIPTDMAPMKTRRIVEDRLRYNLYRFPEDTEADISSWTTLAENISAREYYDETWNGVSKGIYRYAVTARYDDEHTSEATVSDIVGKDMHTSLKINVFTNTPENESAGTEISMVRDDGRFAYNETAGANGTVSIDRIWKGTYNITALKSGYEPVAMQIDLADEPSYMVTLNLKESVFTPVGLKVVNDGVSDQRLLVWNIPELIKDSFEESQGHEVFTIASPGNLGWDYLDADGNPTGALNIYWPNQFEPMSWMTFNPYLTEPSAVGQGLMPPAKDGDQFLMTISSNPLPNDDWLISPRLFFTEPFQLSFYAAGFNPYAAPEIIQIGHSESDKTETSFTWFDPIELSGQKWENFKADFEPETRYVAVRYVKQNGYMAFLDDFRIGNSTDILMDQAGYYTPEIIIPEGPATYEIWINDRKVATTDRRSYLLTDLGNGDYKASVRQVYKSGYSGFASAEFSITGSSAGVNDVYMSGINVNGNILKVNGGCDNAAIVSVSGVITELGAGETFNLDGFDAGVYIVRIEKAGVLKNLKVIIK